MSGAESAKHRGPSGMLLFMTIFLLLHIPLFIYPVFRLGDWLGLGDLLVWITALPIVLSQIISRWLLRKVRQEWLKRLRQFADLILGISPVVLINLLLAEIAVALGWIAAESAAWTVLAVSFLIGGLGVLVALYPLVKRVNLRSSKLAMPLRIVQITDVHIGSRSARFLEELLARIVPLEPDLLCITGDFIDAWAVPEKELVALRNLDFPIYFSTGNHERYEDLEAILARLENLGVVVLCNRAVMHRDDVQVIGIDDQDDVRQVERELANIPLAERSFKLLMYHRPVGLEAAASAGIDLMLSGHTHNGQIFPFNLLVKRVFKRIVGMYSLSDTVLYVSQGTGTWGPVMRIGTRSEITLFELEKLE